MGFLSMNCEIRKYVMFIFICLLSPCVMLSQETAPSLIQLPDSGSRLKIITTEDKGRKEIIGTVVNWRTDSVKLTGRDQISHSINIDEIRKAYVQNGTRRHWKRGLIIGAVLGSTMWLINPVKDKNDGWKGLNIGVNSIATVGGAGLGALIGSAIKTPTWKEAVIR